MLDFDHLHFIQPEVVTIIGVNDKQTKFVIGKVPWLGGGRQALAEYIPTGMPKVGDYQKNEDIARILYSNAAIVIDGETCLKLDSDTLVNNHLTDIMTAAKLEAAVFDKSTDFLISTKVRSYREAWEQQLDSILVNLPTQLQTLSSALISQLSENSEKKSQ